MTESVLLNKMILVAEDNNVNQMIVGHALHKMGCSIDIVGNGFDAIEKLKEKKYDLVLMDIQMPCMDGYETVTFIRNQLQSKVPVIAMTAFALKGEEEKCYENGMNGYVSKPFNLESLGDAMEKALVAKVAPESNPYVLSMAEVAVDVSLLYDISANDESYIQLMVQTFIENMAITLGNMEEAFAEQDWEKVYKAAHYAKSSLSIIKIYEMFEPVLTIEVNAKKKINLQALPGLIEKVKDKFKYARQILASEFNINLVSINTR